MDLAFVCASACVEGRNTFGMELLAPCRWRARPLQRLHPLVPARSKAQSMSDLHGTVFAFTAPISLSGRVYPTCLPKIALAKYALNDRVHRFSLLAG